MIHLTHEADNGWFDVFVSTTFIGHIWRSRADNKWVFEADLGKIPDSMMSDITDILHTLNL